MNMTNETISIVLADSIECRHLIGRSTKADNSKSLTYELGARDSVTIFARQELLIMHTVEQVQVVDSQSAGATTIWSDRIRSSGRTLMYSLRNVQDFFDELIDLESHRRVVKKQRVH